MTMRNIFKSQWWEKRTNEQYLKRQRIGGTLNQLFSDSSESYDVSSNYSDNNILSVWSYSGLWKLETEKGLKVYSQESPLKDYVQFNPTKIFLEMKLSELENPIIKENIIIDSRILHGNPVIKGTRVPVYIILDNLSDGASIEKIMEGYRLTRVQVQACIDFASCLTKITP